MLTLATPSGTRGSKLASYMNFQLMVEAPWAPMPVRMAKNIYAFVADVVVLWVGLTLCPLLEKTLRKHFPEFVKG